MSAGSSDEPFRLSGDVRQRLPADVDADRLKAFVAQAPAADRDFYLELALAPGVPRRARPGEGSPPERVASIEPADAPRGLRFSDAGLQAAWRAVFHRAV